MLPAFLITLREVIEASLIVATIAGILIKLKEKSHLRVVWLGTIAAAIVSIGLLAVGSITGLKIQELYSGRTEQLFEGTMMMVSAVFITWAVFWLHKYFAYYKVRLLQKVKSTIAENQQKSLFFLVFTAVFREGFEVVLFLSTIYLSEKPDAVLGGFSLGLAGGLIIALLFITATLKLPVYRAFQVTTVLLILFAAGLLGRGVHEFTEAGMFPEISQVTLSFIPPNGHLVGDLLKSIFGWSHKMTSLQLVAYALYIEVMRKYIYHRKEIQLGKR